MKCRKLELQTSWGLLTLVGGSRAGEGTLLMLPQLRTALDIGRPQRKLPSMSTLCISHGHSDHLNALSFWAGQRALNDLRGGKILAPSAIAEKLREILRIHAEMEGEQSYDVEVQAVEEGSTYPLRANFHLEFFDVPHRIPSLGSRLIFSRKQLRPEFRDKSRQELEALRAAGEKLSCSESTAILSYTADCSVEIFSRPEKLAAEVLLLECSFWDESDHERARRYGHLHLDDILEHLHLISSRHIVLLHASRRYRLQEILEWIDTRLRPRTQAEIHHLIVEWE